MAAIELMTSPQDAGVIGAIGADDHLRALSRRRKSGRLGAAMTALLRGVHQATCLDHGPLDVTGSLFRRQALETGLHRQFDIDRQPIGEPARRRHQVRRGVRDHLQMQITAIIVILAQAARDIDHRFHRIVGIADDARRKKQSLNIVALVEIEGEIHQLACPKAGARHVGGRAIDAKDAVINAKIRQQHFQERDAAAVRRVGMADTRTTARAYALAVERVSFRPATGRAGRVVFRSVGENRQLVRNRERLSMMINVHVMFLSVRSSFGKIAIRQDAISDHVGDDASS